MGKAPAHNAILNDPSGFIVALADEAFMALYRAARRNARRLTRLGFALLPLMMLLVGSCKVSEVTDNFAGREKSAQFRAALFPDRAFASGGDYQPAGGYVSRAQDFVAGNPDSLTRLTEMEIGFLYGRPERERRDANARVWQYKTASCVVDFFFYDDKDNLGASPVSFVDFRLKKDLDPEAEPRTAPVSAPGQGKCLKKIFSRTSI